MTDPLDVLLQWVKDHSTEINSGVEFKRTPVGIACFAGATLSDELFEVPEDITITPDLAAEVFGMNHKGNRNALTRLLLSKLRFDAGETISSAKDLKSWFRPYLDILPTAHETGSPLFWGVERDLIKGSDALVKVDLEIKRHLDDWYSVVTQMDSTIRPVSYEEEIKFYEVLKDGKPGQFASYLNNPTSWTSFPAYLWACAIFNSRAFPYILNETKAQDLNEAFLLPVFDLLNHNHERSNVKWELSDGKYIFKTKEPIPSGVEVFNSYGPKTNEELLLNYGFALERNPDDKTTLALRIPEDQVENAIKFGVPIDSYEIAFDITRANPLQDSLIILFCFLLKNSSEKAITLRNKLEGLKYLASILQQKIDALKPVSAGSIDAQIAKNAKIFRVTQKQLFQSCLEECLKVEKSLLKNYKPLSFKTMYKNDKAFANALLLIFGITSYEQLSKTDDLDRVLILWIIRCSNKKHYTDKGLFPDLVCQTYESEAKSITITKKDIEANVPVFKALFPAIAQKVPEVFGKGEWGIKSFVVAEAVRDKVCFERKTNNEVFFLEDVRI